MISAQEIVIKKADPSKTLKDKLIACIIGFVDEVYSVLGYSANT